MLMTFLLILHIPFCICVDTITTNQSITDNNVLLSKKGVFALGFFSPGNSRNKYLGIWYHKLPGKTLVWVANREEPINGSSKGVLSMNPDGNLALYDDHGGRSFPLWLTNVSLDANGSYEAQLLDSGNLVLIQVESKSVVWQSFDHPTDTQLPGMKLGLDRKTGLVFCITSWRSEEDPGAGDFTFKLNPSGSPQLILYKGSAKHWRSPPWPWTKMVGATTPENVYRYTFLDNQDEVSYSYFVVDESIFTRSVISSSGLLQRLTWDNSSRQWKQVWSSSQYVYGYCGPNSIHNGNNVVFECTCLPGYEPKSLKNWQLRDGSDGCVKKHQTISMCRNGEGFLKVSQLRLPDTSVAALLNKTVPGKECEQLCLSNCSCLAFVGLDIDGKGIGCLTWHGDLLDTVQFLEGNEIYVRVDAIELAESDRKRRSFLRKKWVLAIMVFSAALTMFLFIMIAHLWLRKKRKKAVQRKWTKRILHTLVEHETAGNRQPPDLPLFDLSSISAATDKFSPANKLGQGGFGSVYKGQLPDGQEIAVKRLSQSSGQGIEEFKNEVLSIARLQHRNLVKLLGCCIQREERMLVYEYLPNKSLDFFIFDQRRRSLLDWGKWFDIIVGIARGVLYLHHDSRLRIIHRDLKASNVLLDAEMNPKISDFGMARIVQGDQVQDKTKRVVGTYGYMSPEYALFGKFSTKSDVFSFGVILLEIISGKKSTSPHQDNPSWNLIAHVWDLWREERAMDIADSSLIDSCSVPPTEVCRCIQIGLLCVQEEAADRPNMATVLVMLNGETSLPCPKQPAFVFRKRCIDSKTPPMKGGGADNISENGLTITMVEPR